MFSLALSLAYFWTGREEGGSWIVTAWLKSKMAGANTVSFTQKGLCKLQAHSKKAWCEEWGSDGDTLIGVLQGKGALIVRRIQQEDGAQHLFAHGHCHLNLRLLKSSGPLVLPADDFAKGWLVWNSEGPSPLWRLSRDDPAKDRIHSIEADRLKLPDQPFLVVHGSELWRVAGQLGTHPRLQEWTV